MIETLSLLPGITLRCFHDSRFKQSCLSIQFVRKPDRQEAAMNALLPAVLLRGCVSAPDLRCITLRLDDLYGASVGALVRKVGDYQTTGLHCSFISDRFTMENDSLLEPVAAFLKELLLDPVTEKGAFLKSYVNSEKKNLIAAIESQLNDKRAYASARLLEEMCRQDSYGIPRLGEKSAVKAVTPKALFAHYRRVLQESPVELFYVGDAPAQQVAAMLKTIFAELDRNYVNLPAQTAFQGEPAGDCKETMDVAQGKLAMGFVTPTTLRHADFASMQVLNMIFGGGMTSKLFMNVREKMSLCYDIGSGYHGSKGIVTVCAGIDCQMEQTVRQEVLAQLEDCCKGNITEEELISAKEALISSLRGVHDTPGAIEGYYSSGVLSGLNITPAEYIQKIEAVTLAQVAQAASSLQLHTVYFLRGEG